MLAKDLAKGGVKQVGRRMVPHREVPGQMVDLKSEGIAEFDRAEFDVDFVERLARRGFGNSDDLGFAAIRLNLARIAHLTAGLGVESRPIEGDFAFFIERRNGHAIFE